MTSQACTPGFLRGAAVAAIIASLHTRADGGTWELHSLHQENGTVKLTFKIGTVYRHDEDYRQVVRVTVEEEPV